MFGRRTHHDHEYDQLISGLQKYGRRRELSRMLYCVREILTTHNPSCATNLIHRIEVMASEEVVFADTGTFAIIAEHLDRCYAITTRMKTARAEERIKNRLDQTWDDDVGLRPGDPYELLNNELSAACTALVNGRLCRLASDVRCWYSMDSTVAERRRVVFDRIDPPHKAPLINRILFHSQCTEQTPEIQVALRSFTRELLELSHEPYATSSMDFIHPEQECIYVPKAPDFLYGAFVVLNSIQRSPTFTYLRSYELGYILWHIILGVDELCDRGKHSAQLLLYRKLYTRKVRERFMWLVNAAMLVFHSFHIKPMAVSTEWQPQTNVFLHTLEEHLQLPVMPLHQDVIDRHTRVGRRRGATYTEFAVHGAFVVDEDAEYYVSEWRRAYLRHKELQDAESVVVQVKPVKPKRAPLKRQLEVDSDSTSGLEDSDSDSDSDSGLEESESESDVEPDPVSSTPMLLTSTLPVPSIHPWSTFEPIVFANDGNVCGQKIACIVSSVRNTVNDGWSPVILKECMSMGSQWGRSAIVVNALLEMAGLPSSRPRVIMSDRRVRRLDRTNKSFVNNYVVEERLTRYLLMDRHPGEPLKLTPGWEDVPSIRRQWLTIACVRAVVRCSDTNCSNMLYDRETGRVYSIDESCILTTRPRVLGQTNERIRARTRADEEGIKQAVQVVQRLDVEAIVGTLNENGFCGAKNRPFIADRIVRIEQLVREELSGTCRKSARKKAKSEGADLRG